MPDVFVGDVHDSTWREWQRRPRIYQADVDVVREVLLTAFGSPSKTCDSSTRRRRSIGRAR